MKTRCPFGCGQVIQLHQGKHAVFGRCGCGAFVSTAKGVTLDEVATKIAESAEEPAGPATTPVPAGGPPKDAKLREVLKGINEDEDWLKSIGVRGTPPGNGKPTAADSEALGGITQAWVHSFDSRRAGRSAKMR